MSDWKIRINRPDSIPIGMVHFLLAVKEAACALKPTHGDLSAQLEAHLYGYLGGLEPERGEEGEDERD